MIRGCDTSGYKVGRCSFSSPLLSPLSHITYTHGSILDSLLQYIYHSITYPLKLPLNNLTHHPASSQFSQINKCFHTHIDCRDAYKYKIQEYILFCYQAFTAIDMPQRRFPSSSSLILFLQSNVMNRKKRSKPGGEDEKLSLVITPYSYMCGV